jgi:hypothetical protein
MVFCLVNQMGDVFMQTEEESKGWKHRDITHTKNQLRSRKMNGTNRFTSDWYVGFTKSLLSLLCHKMRSPPRSPPRYTLTNQQENFIKIAVVANTIQGKEQARRNITFSYRQRGILHLLPIITVPLPTTILQQVP